MFRNKQMHGTKYSTKKFHLTNQDCTTNYRYSSENQAVST